MAHENIEHATLDQLLYRGYETVPSPNALLDLEDGFVAVINDCYRGKFADWETNPAYVVFPHTEDAYETNEVPNTCTRIHGPAVWQVRTPIDAPINFYDENGDEFRSITMFGKELTLREGSVLYLP